MIGLVLILSIQRAAPAAVPLTPVPNVFWSIVPVPSVENDAREEISRVVQPGQVVEEMVRIRASGSETLNLELAAAGGRTGIGGELEMVAGDRGSDGFVSWTRLQEQSVAVPAGGLVDVAFSITVPQDAQPGDVVGGIVASLRSQFEDSSGVSTVQRQGVRVNLRIDGPIMPALAVSDISLKPAESVNPLQPWDLEVTYAVTNTGNIRLGAKQKIETRTLLGDKSFDPPDLEDLLPGDRLVRTFVIPEALRVGRGTANIVLTPFPAFDGEVLTPQPPSVAASQTTWSVPWIMLAEILVASALIWALLRSRNRRRSHRFVSEEL